MDPQQQIFELSYNVQGMSQAIQELQKEVAELKSQNAAMKEMLRRIHEEQPAEQARPQRTTRNFAGSMF